MALLRSLAAEAAMASRLVSGLGPFFSAPLTLRECRSRVERSLEHRQSRFLALVRRGIYEHPPSPYLPLLKRAGASFADVEALVARGGVEYALARLYDAGVRVTLDEFKGRHPIRRGDLEVVTTGRTFDNPLSTTHYQLQSSGSRGPAARHGVDLDMLTHEACYERLFMEDFGFLDRPFGLWRIVPPGGSALKTVLRLSRVGIAVDRWFSQTPLSFRHGPKHAIFLRTIQAAARLRGRPFPTPVHVSLQQAEIVAEWVAARRAEGRPAVLSTSSSCAVRVSAAALERGLDIRGTFFRSGGEPLSEGKMEVIRRAGCGAQTHFAMSEVGLIGIGCRHAVAPDDVHLMADKVAVLQREAGAAGVPGLWLSTIHWSAPRLMMNVDLGDYGVIERRRCGCVWDSLGFTEHFHTIRSYEKLTTGGMHFVGADLIALAEETLPARFGGHATDFQFVEEEEHGLPRVHLVISPRVGPLDEDAVAGEVLSALGGRDAAHRAMAAFWRDGQTLRIVRREPYATRTGKIQTLHLARPAEVAS
jgi:hypothetical protein